MVRGFMMPAPFGHTVPRRPGGRRRRRSSLSSVFSRVRADRRRSASTLVAELLGAIAREVGDWEGETSGEIHRRAREIAGELARTQPAMGTFGAWSAQWAKLSRSTSGIRLQRAAASWARDWKRQLSLEPARLARTVRAALPAGSRVVTLSRSATLFRALAALPGPQRPREVVALESLPGGEGRLFALELRRAGVPSRLVRDRALESSVSAATIVLIGADSVYKDGSVVHKIGTRRLAVAARRAGVPFVVVTGRSKWTRSLPRPGPLPRRFDRTPGRFVTAFWTDRGVEPAARGRLLARADKR
jgi:translation initiation factor 2B subunit (eIF-2B alpha/beta/delta family)